jgi:CHAT domain-containing protein
VSLISCFSADQQGDRPEFLGLSALLAAAGIKNFIGCLWAIPDNAAAAIARSMYRKLAAESTSMGVAWF